MTQINIKSVLLGLLIEAVLYFAALAIIVGIEMSIYGTSAYEPADAYKNDTLNMYVGISVSALISVIAGYATGAIARRSEPLNACVVGFIIMIMFIIKDFSESSLTAVAFMGLVSTVLCHMVGGFFAQQRRVRRMISTPQ
jgi:hypothetical protein